VGVFFYLSSEGQYILVSEIIMAVLFLFIIILTEVLIDSGRFSLLKVRYKIYFS
jgi:hypothetical protein